MELNETQLKQVRKHLIRHGKITSWGAITNYRITRLSQYILLLRQEGLNIETEWGKSNGKRYGIYILKR